MGNSIDKIDDGFYICGCQALADVKRLQSLGIKRILNAATLDLYDTLGSEGERVPLTELFDVKCLGCMDAECENLSIHFEDIAEFIHEGRRLGGVVVHCAAGVSRASTSCLSYLMLREHLSLKAAFLKVFAVRTVIRPNPGFWRQLRDLEAVLQRRGVDLQPITPEAVGLAEAATSAGDDEGVQSLMYDSPSRILEHLDAESAEMQPFITHFLTARIQVKEGVHSQDLIDAKLEAVRIKAAVEVEGSPGVFDIRAKCVPSMDGASLRVTLEALPGVVAVIAAESSAGQAGAVASSAVALSGSLVEQAAEELTRHVQALPSDPENL